MPGEVPPPPPVTFVALCDPCGYPRAAWIARRFGVSNTVIFPSVYVIGCKRCTRGGKRTRERVEREAAEFEAAAYATYALINQPWAPWSGMTRDPAAGTASTPA